MGICTLICMYIIRIDFPIWLFKARFLNENNTPSSFLTCSLWLLLKLKAQPINMVTKPSVVHSQELQPHLHEVFIWAFAFFFYFFSSHFLQFLYRYFNGLLLDLIFYPGYSSCLFQNICICDSDFHPTMTIWVQTVQKWEEILHHFWMPHSSFLSYGLYLLMPWSQWK